MDIMLVYTCIMQETEQSVAADRSDTDDWVSAISYDCN